MGSRGRARRIADRPGRVKRAAVARRATFRHPCSPESALTDLVPSLSFLVAAIATAVAVALLVARAAARERLRLQDAALAELRRERDEALARLAALSTRESELRARLAEAETRLAEEREQWEEKRELLAATENKLSQTFDSLAARALEANAESFLRQAKQSFATLQATAEGDLEQRKQAIEAVVAPMREQLAKYEEGVRQLERAREHAYGTLSEQLRTLVGTQQRLEAETGNLVKALRAPQVRGRWGEMHLRRAIEFAGMVDHVDFVEQESVAGDEGSLRPDLKVRLPGGKYVVVDAKAPLDAYLSALEAPDEDQRLAFLREHARQVRDHIRKLTAKAYWAQFDSAPDFVVLYLPSESLFSAALEQDAELIEDAFRQSVLVATPTTLVALLKSVHYGWQQETLAANARQIAEEARKLYDRVRVFGEHLDRVGKGLQAAVEAHNQAAGSFSLRVLPQGRRLEELALAPEKRLEAPRAVDASARELGPGESDDADDADDTGHETPS
jgi:DNA recombination protein RmuC